MSKSKFSKRLVAIILTAMFVVSILPMNIFAADNGNSSRSVSWQKIDSLPIDLKVRQEIKEVNPENLYKDTDIVRVSVILDDDATLVAYDSQGIADNAKANAYRSNLDAKQDLITEEIAGIAGDKVDVVWNLTLLQNAISINIPFGLINDIKHIKGVKDVVLENQYYLDTAESVDVQPQNVAATEMTGGTYAWSSGYTGAGRVIAVVDTGLDADHEMFDEEGFKYSIQELEESGKTVDLMTLDDISDKWDLLNVSKYGSFTADDVYRSEKVPFGFNYVMKSLDMTHDDGTSEHGSHVASIAVGNKYVKRDGEFVPSLSEVFTQGEAPDAQLLVMKVFGAKNAYDSDIISAVEDAIVLGADAVNLSLGSSVAGIASLNSYEKVINSIPDTNVIWVNSGGNAYYSSYFTLYEFPYIEDKNFATGGTPGVAKNTLSVASADNIGQVNYYLDINGSLIFYSDTTGYSNERLYTIAGEHDYLLIDGYGTAEEFAQVADELSGKVALCSRGNSSFYEKANNAIANGAIATIIYNNQPGVINMNLTGYSYTAPAVSITMDDADLFRNAGEMNQTDDGLTYYVGKFTISGEQTPIIDFNGYVKISDFSSWGVPGNLTLKPEITAPGGNILAANGKIDGGQEYEVMSGTSMAAPQVAGVVALISQYIEEQGLVEKTGLSQRQLVQSLLMSTSTPLIEEESGYYYSVLKQGSGLINAAAALNSKTYIFMNEDATESAADGKIKAELGDDPERNGTYSFGFTVNNMTSEDVVYELSSEFFTQDYFFNYVDSGDIVPFSNIWTFPLLADVSFTIDGEEYVPADEYDVYDVNGDEAFNVLDVIAILNYVVNEEPVTNEDVADFDDDSDIDTYDAYLALQVLDVAQVVVPADGSVEVQVDIQLLDIENYDALGAYIEGYIFIDEMDSDEGVIGVSHSIPVIGYYGAWGEFPMTDVGSYWEFAEGTETRDPYMAYDISDDAKYLEAFISSSGNGKYVIGGNPYFGFDYDDEGNIVHAVERDALRPDDNLYGAQYTLIRTSAGGKFILENETTGDVIFDGDIGPQYAAYYNQEDLVWDNYGIMAYPDIPLKDISDGDILTAKVRFAPEYYMKDDGTIDWDSFPTDYEMIQTFMIDGEAPEINNIMYGVNAVSGTEGLTIDLSDNHYIAAVVVANEDESVMLEFPADLDEQEGASRSMFIANGTEEGEIDFSIPENQHLYIAVYDYAYNQSSFKLNLNEAELSGGPKAIVFDPAVLNMIKGNVINASYTVEPWGVDETVTWSSGDNNVATVDENGVITATGVGSTIITATSAVDTSVFSDLEVNVIEIDKDLNAFIWDETGKVWLSEFNLKNLPNYTPLTETSFNKPFTSTALEADGTLYLATFNEDEFLSDLYTLDTTTFEPTLIGSSSIGYMDITAAPTLGDNIIMGCYGPYLVLVDTTTGDYAGVFNMSKYIGAGNNIVGVTYAQSYYNSSYSAYVDYFYFLCKDGSMFLIGIMPYNGSYANFAANYMITIGAEIDVIYFQGFYFDGDYFYWSRYNKADNMVNLIVLDAATGNEYEIGNFAEGVWPVSGLVSLEDNFAEAMAPHNVNIPLLPNKMLKKAPVADKRALSEIDGFADNLTADEIALIAQTVKPVTRGTINDISAETEPEPEVEVDDDPYLVTITAEEALNNALVTVNYDVSELTVETITVAPKYNVLKNDAENGVITIAFATLEAIEADGTIATVKFTPNEGICADVTVNVTIEGTSENNVKEPVELVLGEHSWNPATFEWSKDYSSVTATRVCSIHDTHVETETVETTVKVIPAMCEKDGETIYTAKFENEAFGTQTKSVAIPAHGHEWDEGKVILTATENWEGLIRYTCIYDSSHTKTEVIPKVENETQHEKWYYIGQILRKLADEKAKEQSEEPKPTDNPDVPVTPEPDELPFKDVSKDSPYYDAIKFVFENELFKGVAADLFAPDGTMTRGMFVTVLGRLAQVDPEGTNTSVFSDVEDGQWYTPYVDWAAEEGLILGYGDGTFKPDNNITREQAILIIQRYVEKCGISTETEDALTTSDAAEVADWSYDAVKWGVNKGIFELTDEGKVDPKSNATRAYIAELLYNLVDVLAE